MHGPLYTHPQLRHESQHGRKRAGVGRWCGRYLFDSGEECLKYLSRLKLLELSEPSRPSGISDKGKLTGA